MVHEILTKIRFDAIVETGTFRGITTEWFAMNFGGPVLSCDSERLYHLQAAHRLSRFPQVKLTLSDLRDFLRREIVSCLWAAARYSI